MNQLAYLLLGKPHPMPWMHDSSKTLADGRAYRIRKARDNALKYFTDEWRSSYRLAALAGKTRGNMISYATRFTEEGVVEERTITLNGRTMRQWRLKNDLSELRIGKEQGA